ncbi:MAG: hypothetical protein Faunusvirus8_17 [Faunusvirus sp.]|jgi:hypothetical protein|uniref:Uncharacterized protein n=1 Tax=Faunusvirus sp. TaxID=2487766 RepID=A0A3G4ZWS9_9VIRU|nr:MAG: hypothetical protein Faunusvirus8_17 [Faunusvirus sp.]
MSGITVNNTTFTTVVTLNNIDLIAHSDKSIYKISITPEYVKQHMLIKDFEMVKNMLTSFISGNKMITCKVNVAFDALTVELSYKFLGVDKFELFVLANTDKLFILQNDIMDTRGELVRLGEDVRAELTDLRSEIAHLKSRIIALDALSSPV